MADASLVNIGFVLGTLVGAFFAFVAIVVSDKLISHSIDIKKSLLMSLIALFIVPIVAVFLAGFIPLLSSVPFMASIILPIIFWIILGEILLKSDRMTKMKVAAIAFVVYIILDIFLKPYVISVIPF